MMRMKKIKLTGESVAVLLLLDFTASGQSAINWHTTDGGGGTSNGGVYSVSGTIGQPDAGGQ